ncbi:chromosomal replication initiator protein DnaA [Clostridium homopropionicum DSM 5847]|uniref:Chromosomal replication initiator protein DnaA n=3 Tax=Clostridium TaxID=1485 RepID=A0A0L6Z6W1_9CLOT|nr:IS21-like element helper ATPase IstB [Clostridium homopropionicum]KOA18578.1 chromosomal replication initiator protein DnaA [Clostridium homopropionicum DSM 5847]
MDNITYERVKENLKTLDLTNTLEIIDNYLELAIKDDKNIVEILDHLLTQEVKFKSKRAAEIQVSVAAFPFRKLLEEFDFDFQPSIDKRLIDELATLRFVSNAENVVFLGPPGVGKTHLAIALGIIAAKHRYLTYYISCQDLISQLNKAHFENKLALKIKHYAKYRLLIIDEIGYLPMDIQGANLFFQLIAKRYEKCSTIFTSNKSFSQWGEVFSDNTIAAAILDRILHHATVVNIKGDSYRLKDRKEFMNNKKDVINTLIQSK